MKTQQSGFTLIEMIAVMVVVGILAATALPQFVDLSDSAEDASAKGVAGALNSAASLNYAAYLANDAGLAGAPSYSVVATCGDHSGLLQGGALPTGYSIAGTLPACTVTSGSATANFVGIAAP